MKKKSKLNELVELAVGKVPEVKATEEELIATAKAQEVILPTNVTMEATRAPNSSEIVVVATDTAFNVIYDYKTRMYTLERIKYVPGSGEKIFTTRSFPEIKFHFAKNLVDKMLKTL